MRTIDHFIAGGTGSWAGGRVHQVFVLADVRVDPVRCRLNLVAVDVRQLVRIDKRQQRLKLLAADVVGFWQVVIRNPGQLQGKVLVAVQVFTVGVLTDETNLWVQRVRQHDSRVAIGAVAPVGVAHVIWALHRPATTGRHHI